MKTFMSTFVGLRIFIGDDWQCPGGSVPPAGWESHNRAAKLYVVQTVPA
jgi:hypothetical protein